MRQQWRSLTTMTDRHIILLHQETSAGPGEISSGDTPPPGARLENAPEQLSCRVPESAPTRGALSLFAVAALLLF
jgi:hypothetical protein